MEGLVLLLSGLIELFVLVIPLMIEAVVLLIGVIGQIVALLFELLTGAGIEALRRKPQPAARETPPPPGITAPPVPQAALRAPSVVWSKVRTWSRRAAVAGGVLLVVTVAAIGIANFFFFEHIVRWSLRGLEQRHGVAVAFESADGNLFTGAVRLRGAHLVRAQHPVSEFDVTIHDLQADIDLSALWQRRLEFQSVAARGVRGDYTRVGPQPDQLPRRGFVVQQLLIEDAQLTWHDVTQPNRPIQLDIEVDSLETAPFRSKWAAFDVQFRTNARGRVAGGPFQVTTREIADGRETRWNAQGLPVSFAGAYLGGPFSWITEGTLNVDVVDRWSIPEDALDIEMDWQLVLKDIRAEARADLPAPARAVAGPIVKYLNEHPRELPLAFSVTINRREFAGRMSPPLEFLMQVLGDAATNELADRLGIAKQAVRDAGRGAWEGVKDFLDRRRGAEERE